MHIRSLVLGSFIFLFFSLKTALGYELYYSNAHPFMAHNHSDRGFLADLVIKAGELENLNITPVFVPWKRAQFVTENRSNKLIFAVRTPKREEKYTWLTPLHTMKTVIATNGALVNSLTEASSVLNHMTVMPGIALHRYVLKEGFPEDKLRTIPVDESLMDFLTKRPKTGWIAQKMQIKSFWAKYAKNTPLAMGDVITERELWLACSKDCNHIPTEVLTQSIVKLKESSWFKNRKDFYTSSH